MKNICHTMLVFSLFMFVSTFSYGQVNGYMGKRLSMEVNLNTGYVRMSPINADYSTSSLSSSSSTFSEVLNNRKFNFYPEFTLSFTVGKNTDIGLLYNRDMVDVRLQEYGISLEGLEFYTAQLEPASSGSSSYYYFYPDFNHNTGTSNSYQFYIRKYIRGQIAPVGFYHQFAFGINRIGYTKNITGELRNSTDGPSTMSLDIETEKINLYKLSYFFGNKKVYANGIYINSGFSFNLPFVPKILKAPEIESQQTSYNYHYLYLKQLQKELRYNQFLDFKLGIGFIF